MNITNVIKKDYVKAVLKRKKSRIITNNDNSGDNDHEMNTILREQLRRF